MAFRAQEGHQKKFQPNRPKNGRDLGNFNFEL